MQHQLARLRAEDSLHRLAALLLADSRISQVHAKRFAAGNDLANRAKLLCDRLGAIALVRQLEQRLSVRDGVRRGVLGFRHSCVALVAGCYLPVASRKSPLPFTGNWQPTTGNLPTFRSSEARRGSAARDRPGRKR